MHSTSRVACSSAESNDVKIDSLYLDGASGKVVANIDERMLSLEAKSGHGLDIKIHSINRVQHHHTRLVPGYIAIIGLALVWSSVRIFAASSLQIFTLLGGLFAIRSGVIKAMFVSGVLMASTNLLFSLLAWSGKSELLFAIAVIFDDMAAAFATVAFVAFISMLVDRTYTATQYALLASIGTAGRTTLAASSGALVDWLNGDWGIFFIITALMVIPSLIFLYMIRHKLKLND